jgi:hypothetical protein
MRVLSRRVLVCGIVGLTAAATWTAAATARQRATAGMAKAAQSWVASLTPEQRQKAVFPIFTGGARRPRRQPIVSGCAGTSSLRACSSGTGCRLRR